MADSKPSSSTQKRIEAINRARDALVEKIRGANSVTESESLAVGSSLGAIVEEAKAHAIESRRTLEEYAQTGLVSQMAQQNELLSSFLSVIERHITAQARTALTAAEQVNRIVGLGQAIARVTVQAKMLALNATIEASRMGAAGAAFHVISQEMKQFSQAVNDTSSLVQELAEQLLRTIPEMAQIADVMKGAAADFKVKAQAQIVDLGRTSESLSTTVKGSLNASEARLEKVLSLSYEALSHLQFQDTVAQSLLSCERILQHLSDEMKASDVADFEDSDSSPLVTPAADSEVEAGEILLF
jgi:methyl-accepting chemotaxis protein